MKTKIKYLLVLVLASFVFAGCCTMHSKKTMQWEYKSVRLSITDKDFDSNLNAAGNGGWKLLTIQSEANVGYSEYIFERPKH